ncbi:MAG: NUDIX domain-containing protein [Alistipes sp.]|nr:NUDIX domain-containing protein [Alistipes sp.]
MKHNDSYTIFFGESELLITSDMPSERYDIVDAEAFSAFSQAKIVKIVENSKCVAVVTPSPKLTFEALKAEFKWVEAAGGVVTNVAGDLLMINLRGRWDLPKGHVESGESSRMAALREVEEETGIRAEVVDDEPLIYTYHTYNTYGAWELKRTTWWVMHSEGGKPKAQSEEGISSAEWCERASLHERLKTTYPTIKRLVERYVLKTSDYE